MSYFKQIESSSSVDLVLVSQLAYNIWTEHYTPIIGDKQVFYMLEKYQSVKAIKSQIQNGKNYYLLISQELPNGYFCYTINRNFIFLDKLYILKKYRGNKLGKQVIDFLLREAKSQSLKKIQLTVNKYNERSIKIYEKMGFIIMRELTQEIGRGFIMDDYLMEKSI